MEMIEAFVTPQLIQWAKQQKEAGFFVDSGPLVQTAFRQVVDYVNNTYPQYQASEFLNKADPWIIAHAKVYGGRVVTFEKSAPSSRKPRFQIYVSNSRWTV